MIFRLKDVIHGGTFGTVESHEVANFLAIPSSTECYYNLFARMKMTLWYPPIPIECLRFTCSLFVISFYQTRFTYRLNSPPPADPHDRSVKVEWVDTLNLSGNTICVYCKLSICPVARRRSL